MSVRRRVLVVALVGYCVFLAIILLAPSSSEQSQWVARAQDLALDLGVDPRLTTPSRAQFVCNALILVPVSALGSLVWARTTWRDWTAVAFLLAGLVELVQGVFLDARTASYVDIVANALGGLGGAAMIAVLRLTAGKRRQELD